MTNPFTAKLKSQTNFYTTIGIVLALILVLNLIFSFLSARVDLTQSKEFSVSPVTKNIVKNLDDIINIKAYFTSDAPGYLITVRQEVKDILEEYKNYSRGKINIEFFDPNSNDQAKEEAQRLGIPAVQFNVVKKDKFEVAQGYLGVAIIYGEKVEIIPTIENTQTLEYDLTRAIKKVTAEKIRTIGILEQKNDTEQKIDLTGLNAALSEQYQIAAVDLASQDLIPDNIDTLIIVGSGQELTAREQFIIDQFIMSGRGVLILAGRVNVGENLLVQPVKSGLEDALNSYGVVLKENLVFDPLSQEMANFSQGMMQFFVPYGFWPKVVKKGFSQESGIVNKLESLSLPWTSSMDILKDKIGDKTKIEILAFTSPKSVSVEKNWDISPNGPLPSGAEGSQNAAVYISGALDSYYKDKEIPAKAESAVSENTTKLSNTESARVIIVSNSLFAESNFLKRFQGNAVFLQNAVDAVTLDSDLINIRSKAVTDRPLTNLSDGVRSTIKYLNIFAPAMLFAFFGILRFFFRRRR